MSDEKEWSKKIVDENKTRLGTLNLEQTHHILCEQTIEIDF